ncbi:unnamed protein product [Bursaphelenchus okinawaensis]|uniref:SH3 domain-containing protein n=1 Tax=Bursaphelenchus okinawaensis TaxID=465554 RepID=A0A811KQN6_9BILA|nr:unnamed protein product [Bursaphelenchus okinawaensis]CAG9110695.1 unnamed protein product [Bursaphelenchus okinawaensis]
MIFYIRVVNNFIQHIEYRVLYPYEPRQGDELELEENDIVFVVEKCEDGWFIGTSLKSGQFGTFPGNYVVKH